MNSLEIRKFIKEKRNALSEKQILTLSNIITKKVLSLDLSAFNNIFIYRSFRSEVSTELLIKNFLSQNKTLAFPVTIGENILAGIPTTKENALSPFGVSEPKNYTIMDKVELCIVPLLACDKNKNRIGYGKGFYDRFFVNNPCYKIGICFDFQVVDSLTPNAWDIPLDMIITDKQIIK